MRLFSSTELYEGIIDLSYIVIRLHTETVYATQIYFFLTNRWCHTFRSKITSNSSGYILDSALSLVYAFSE